MKSRVNLSSTSCVRGGDFEIENLSFERKIEWQVWELDVSGSEARSDKRNALLGVSGGPVLGSEHEI